MTFRITDAKPDRDHIEKGRLGQRNITALEVRPYVKAEFIDANWQGAAANKRDIRSAIVVRDRGCYCPPVVAAKAIAATNGLI
jgi:hypothetical protein